MTPRKRTRGTLDPKIPSKELTRALNVASARIQSLKKRVLTPEALLLVFVELEEVAAHKLLRDLLSTRGRRWDRFVGEASGLAHERIAVDADFDWETDEGKRIPLSDEMLIVLDEALTLAQARDEVYAGTEHVLVGMTYAKVNELLLAAQLPLITWRWQGRAKSRPSSFAKSCCATLLAC
jgi:hypothetical protein